jgi:hypothetical protein
LDLPPSDAQRRLLWRLSEGAEIALFPDGTYQVRQTGETVSGQTLQACLWRQWITRLPGYPLFDQACRLTPRGFAALNRQVRRELAAAHVTRQRLA